MSKLKFFPMILVLAGLAFGAVACDDGETETTDETDGGNATD
ncbi:MAG: hypothetical protein ACI9MC_001310 [Kiritimatiellia bacterium]|jgi:hypothetical protein